MDGGEVVHDTGTPCDRDTSRDLYVGKVTQTFDGAWITVLGLKFVYELRVSHSLVLSGVDM